MNHLDSLRNRLTHLTDEAILEVNPDDLTEEAKAIYDAELAARGISWPSTEEAPTESLTPTGFPDPADGELVLIARYESFAEARFALTLLRQEEIPVWVAGNTKPGVTMIDPNAPLDLVTQPQHLEAAQQLLFSEISDEELAQLAEEAGEQP